MKRLLMFALFSIASAPASAADVGISISLGQPGFYGQIDIGDYPPPQLIYAEPVVVEQVVVVQQPIYLHVQYDQIKHWDKHCHEYGACGQRVYFVQDSWYDSVYVPNYHKKHGNNGNNGNNGKGKNSNHKDNGHDKQD
jgi:hypothetical protein